jgi:hypothetical protein
MYADFDVDIISSPKSGGNTCFIPSEINQNEYTDNYRVSDVVYTSASPLAPKKKKGQKRMKMPIILRPFINNDAPEIAVKRLRKLIEDSKKTENAQ